MKTDLPIIPADLSNCSFHDEASDQREGLRAYPFFSLPDHETRLLEEFRSLLKELETRCDPALPSPWLGELTLGWEGEVKLEVAFVLRWDCLPAVRQLLEKGRRKLRLHFAGWYKAPKCDRLPAGLDLPRSCFPTLGFELTNPEQAQLHRPVKDFMYRWAILEQATGKVGGLYLSAAGLWHAELPSEHLEGEAAVLEMCTWSEISCSLFPAWIGEGSGFELPPHTITRDPKAFIPAELQKPAE